ncbi:S-adenosyl-L-methionine-dependent methyltransferase [Aspergillus sclerotioniger CBS 115572]|uniref:S-adenosyl-L-methionine-dependent methyltransferase n=1 Tax=Aspergillus sclerotioniger CBS 115572 TaxID=1450535 RepID=A0A317V645_9EURO|nr:S-adenosyl-L-methionine-dependent methyltransferase [Aspergillus sclerotioniger CBS 115572]PWY69009.1 S-adenosyl-L-methionine-dependent methyltransferase [Aspergillus sclerotioniger CBS 115572]
MSIQRATQADTVETYVQSHLAPEDPGMFNARNNSLKHGIPPIALSANQGKFLNLLASCSGARNVLELGTLGGYSSIWLARAISSTGGKVTSIEINPDRREVAIENLRNAGIKVPEEVDVVLGAGLDVLPKLDEEIQRGERQRFDFVFIDADWPNQWKYFDYGVKLATGKGSVVFVDNVVLAMLDYGHVGPEERDESVVPLVEEVAKDERVEAVVMQTLGAKQYDGFLMAVVK